jgi:hypothetical protein
MTGRNAVTPAGWVRRAKVPIIGAWLDPEGEHG